MEFQVNETSLVQNQKIESNIAEVRTWLEQSLEKYKTMVVTEDAVTQAKADRANVNRVQKALADKRIAVEKQYMSNFNKWKDSVKELEKMCAEASQNIDSQVKKFELQKKTEKRNALIQSFDAWAAAAHVTEYVTFEQIENPKWLNATYTMEQATKDIRQILNETTEDIKTIRDMESDFEVSLLDLYKNTHDIRKVLAKNQEYYAQKAREEARRNSAPPKPVEPEAPLFSQAETPKISNPVETAPAEPATKQPKKYNVLLSLEMTASQMRSLNDYFKQNGIKVLQSKSKEVTA